MYTICIYIKKMYGMNNIKSNPVLIEGNIPNIAARAM